MSKIVYTARERVSVALRGYEKVDARNAINVAVFGHKDVNEYDKDRKMVPKPMSKKKLDVLKEAHYGICRSQEIVIEFDVTSDGEFINFRVGKG